MKKSDFHFDLPPELIAQQPLAERSASRLLVLDVGRKSLLDRQFVELPDLLRAGDLLVFNDTRVLPARLYGRKATGGAVEILIERLTGRSSSSGCEISAPAEERSAIISRSFSWYGPEFAIRPKLCLYFAVETISMVRVIFLVFRTDFRRFSRTFALATSGYLRSDSG